MRCLCALLLLVLVGFASASKTNIDCVHCPAYQQATAADKEAIILRKTTQSLYSVLNQAPPAGVELCEVLEMWQKADASNVFDRFSDERPTLRPDRKIHVVGTVASVALKARPDHSFTGLFKGASHGVIRLSEGAPNFMTIRQLNAFSLATYPASVGLKLFRDTMPSGNLLAGKSLHPHKN